MKLTKSQLKQIIKEELSKVLSEQPWEVGHEPVTAEEEAARKEKAAAKHREKAQRLRDLAQKETVEGDAGSDFTEEGRKLMAKADRHEEQAAIVDGQAAKLRSGKPGREERGYGKHLEEIVKEELDKLDEAWQPLAAMTAWGAQKKKAPQTTASSPSSRQKQAARPSWTPPTKAQEPAPTEPYGSDTWRAPPTLAFEHGQVALKTTDGEWEMSVEEFLNMPNTAEQYDPANVVEIETPAMEGRSISIPKEMFVAWETRLKQA